MGMLIWIRGDEPSSGAALSAEIAASIRQHGGACACLPLREIRRALTPSDQVSRQDVEIVDRAITFIVSQVVTAGIPVIVDGTGEVDGHRLTADLPADVRVGEVWVSSDGEAPDRGVAHRALAAARERTSPVGWAIWITGRPGSGKTTIAAHLARALASRNVYVRVLDLASARRAMLSNRTGSESELGIVHRAIAHAAHLLTDAGLHVVIDATAHRRAWRESARAMIPRFAEVELVCPPEICADRERAVRWHLGPSCTPAGACVEGAPDIVLDYEESRRPELRLRTDIHTPDVSADEVQMLVTRLFADATLVR